MNKIFIGIIISITLALVLLFNKKPVSKTGFVTNVSVEKSENPLFIHEIIKYPSNAEIIKAEPNKSILIGLTADPWNVNFGILHPSYESRRFINVANYKDQPYHVKFVCYGNICPMISFSRNDFVLHKGDELQVSVILQTSSSTKLGNYTGEVDVISEGTKIPFLDKVLGWG
jgi:hypothetical protein